MRKRSEVSSRFPRTPDGHINNCSIANWEPEKDCQVCKGSCPDREKFALTQEDRDGLEQQAGEEAFAAAAGERVEATWGEEYFQPAKFTGVKVGPFKASTIVRRGETVAEALVRLHREMEKAAQEIFDVKSAIYLHNLAGIASAASKVEVP
jgi:hypothetical protein